MAAAPQVILKPQLIVIDNTHKLPPDDDPWKLARKAVLDAVNSERSRHAYRIALDDFFAWWNGQGRPTLTRPVVLAFKASLQLPCADGRTLASATINLRMTAVRRLVAEASGARPPRMVGGGGRDRRST